MNVRHWMWSIYNTRTSYKWSKTSRKCLTQSTGDDKGGENMFAKKKYKQKRKEIGRLCDARGLWRRAVELPSLFPCSQRSEALILFLLRSYWSQGAKDEWSWMLLNFVSNNARITSNCSTTDPIKQLSITPCSPSPGFTVWTPTKGGAGMRSPISSPRDYLYCSVHYDVYNEAFL